MAGIGPGLPVESWYGLYVPAGTPPDRVASAQCHGEGRRDGGGIRKRVEPEGLTLAAGAPAELEAYVRAEQARWRQVVRENNIRP